MLCYRATESRLDARRQYAFRSVGRQCWAVRVRGPREVRLSGGWPPPIHKDGVATLDEGVGTGSRRVSWDHRDRVWRRQPESAGRAAARRRAAQHWTTASRVRGCSSGVGAGWVTAAPTVHWEMGENGPAIRRSEPVGQGSEPDRARRAHRRSGSVSRPDRASSQTRSPTCRRDDRSRSFSRSTADSRSAWGKVAAVIPRSGRARAGTGSKDWRTAPLAVTHSWGTNRAAG